MSFDTILKSCQDESDSPKDIQIQFDRIMRSYLLTDPKYAHQLKSVVVWDDFSAREEVANDASIDLVAETTGGEFWAIHCKCRKNSSTIEKTDVDSFLSESAKSFRTSDGKLANFVLRIWISTTDRYTDSAETALREQTIPVTRINSSDLQSAHVDWDKLKAGLHGDIARSPRHRLMHHQEEAVAAAEKYYKHSDRGKLIMACGTGKTFTSLIITQRESNGFTLVLVPAIALIAQILREWTSHSEKPLNTICVCSDPKVSQTKKKNYIDTNAFSTIDLTVPATTDPQRILNRFQGFNNLHDTVIFSTYQSIQTIEAAQAMGLPEFGLIVCDEAHRTTGVTLSDEHETSFVRVHDNKHIRARKRLYMTATPRLYSEDSKSKAKDADAVLCSMDDESLYG
ncbi:MAG: DEAD/DEAH box helicase family protein, partial [Polyangiaceae bacterium]|nr:DEAD/DEAH box helicase family protein [Polyangiaceae bacterium]